MLEEQLAQTVNELKHQTQRADVFQKERDAEHQEGW